MGMGWGMAQGLGNAISKVGDIWGPQRLEQQRLQNEDKRRASEDVRREAESKSTLAMNQESLLGHQQERTFAAQRQPVLLKGDLANVAQSESATKMNDAQRSQIQFQIGELERAKAAQPSDFYQAKYAHEIALRKQALEQGSAELGLTRAQTAAAGRAGANAQATGDEIRARTASLNIGNTDNLYTGMRNYTLPYEKQMQANFDKLHKEKLMVLKAKLDPFGFADTKQLSSDESVVYNKAHADAARMAQWLAEHRLEYYEHQMQGLGKQPYKDPQEKAGIIAKEMQGILGQFMLGQPDDGDILGNLNLGGTAAPAAGTKRSGAFN